MICLQDLFDILKEVRDQDFVLREDVNKLIYILKQKGKNMRVENHISPITYGIYNKYECVEELPPLDAVKSRNPFSKGPAFKRFQSTKIKKQLPAKLLFNEYLAQDNQLKQSIELSKTSPKLSKKGKNLIKPMLWDKTQNKLIYIKEV